MRERERERRKKQFKNSLKTTFLRVSVNVNENVWYFGRQKNKISFDNYHYFTENIVLSKCKLLMADINLLILFHLT